jgi:TolB protein
MDADGNNKKKLTNLQLEDSWMGNRNKGTEMIVSGRIGKLRAQLFLIDLKDGSYKQLTNDTVSQKEIQCFTVGK